MFIFVQIAQIVVNVNIDNMKSVNIWVVYYVNVYAFVNPRPLFEAYKVLFCIIFYNVYVLQ